jgi:uncharacterized protein (DUF1684 family)
MSEQELSIYQAEIEGRHVQRIERLTAPDGWLSLVGLHWVEPGLQRIGSAPDNDIVLATGPEYLAQVLLEDGQIRIDPSQEGGAWHEPGKDGVIGRLRFNEGDASIQVLERGGRTALRVRDAKAPTRTGFAGIERFDTDPGWRFDARFEAHDPPRTMPIVDVLGNSTDTPNPGKVNFTYAGKDYSLEALDEGDGRLFFVFADRTSGKESYGAGRMLYADPAVNGRTVLDFNLAYNPPCAFTAYSTCPLPPPENRLDLAVRAGEKRYLPVN